VPTLPPNLRHVFIIVNPDRKGDVLRRAVHALSLNMGLAFMNWQQRLKDMEAKVAARKIEVGLCQGGKGGQRCVMCCNEQASGGAHLPLHHAPCLLTRCTLPADT
jgi:hypothetical protein